MLEFEKFVARHGEVAAQAVLENLERYEGVRAPMDRPLEERWEQMMCHASSDYRLAA